MLCLADGRYRIEAAWTKPSGASGVGTAVGVTAGAGYFWFFDPDNAEVFVKVLDGCAVNGRVWFFAAGLTNLAVTLTVKDSVSGEMQTYTNPQSTAFQPVQDTGAFAVCGPVPLLVTLEQFQFTPGGPDGPPIRLQAGVSYELTFRSIDVTHGISGIPQLGIANTAIGPGGDYVVLVTPTAAQRGRYNFACTRICGAGHGSMHGAIEVE